MAAADLGDGRCLICLEKFCEAKDGTEIRKLPCNHMFCKGCIDSWLSERSMKCPELSHMFDGLSIAGLFEIVTNTKSVKHSGPWLILKVGGIGVIAQSASVSIWSRVSLMIHTSRPHFFAILDPPRASFAELPFLCTLQLPPLTSLSN